MGRGAAGVKGIELAEGESVVGATSSMEGHLLLVLTSKGFGKMSYAVDTDITAEDGSVRHYDGYRKTHRGSKGVTTVKVTPKNGKLVVVRAVNGDEDALVMTDEGTIIRISLESVAQYGRNTQGVRLINVGEAKVATVTIVAHEQPEELQNNPAENE